MERVRQITRVNEAHKLGYIGNNVTVAVMDTGIGTHIDFGQRIRGFRDYVGDKKILYDDNGHGTHVSGIIAGSGFASHGRYRGMAPGAAIYAIKVLDRMGKGNTRLVVSALKWLISNYEKMNIRILNISVGMLASARREEQEELLAAIEAVWDAGIVVVAAAGNNGEQAGAHVQYPAAYSEVIGVGSVDENLSYSSFSAKGDQVELMAPGENIPITTYWDIQGVGSGTSYAAP